MLVGASCTAELIQDDPGGLARALGLPIPVIPLELPSYQKQGKLGRRRRPSTSWCAPAPAPQVPTPGTQRAARRRPAPRCNLLGPTALGFRHRDDVDRDRSACSSDLAST